LNPENHRFRRQQVKPLRKNGISKSAVCNASVLAAFSVQAGPPLATDDSGVLPTGGWEYTLAYESEQRDVGDTAIAPGLEIAYGFSDVLQGAVGIARVEIDEPGAGSRSDFDAIGFELKWQFYADEQISAALAPAYAFPLTSSSTDRGIVEDVRVLSLPAIVSWESGNWTADAQLAYDMTSSGPNGWFAGLAGGYQATDRVRLLAEVCGVSLIIFSPLLGRHWANRGILAHHLHW